MRIVWIKALLAAVPVALFLAAPASVHADGACTALANDVDVYSACTNKMNVPCAHRPGGFYPTEHLTCTYPDGGRDDCAITFGVLGGPVADFGCTYVPPGSYPAPEPTGEPS